MHRAPDPVTINHQINNHSGDLARSHKPGQINNHSGDQKTANGLVLANDSRGLLGRSHQTHHRMDQKTTAKDHQRPGNFGTQTQVSSKEPFKEFLILQISRMI